MHLYLIRHGKTKYNVSQRLTGWIDSSLDKEGIENALEIREILKNKKIDVVVTSDLRRSIDTAKLSYLEENKEVNHIIEPLIRERDYGLIAGKNKSKLKQKINRLYDLYHRSYYVPPPGGESFIMVEQRVKKFLIPFIKENINKRALISSHGNSLRVIFKILENLSIKETEKLEVKFGYVYEYEIRKNKESFVCRIIKGITSKDKTVLSL